MKRKNGIITVVLISIALIGITGCGNKSDVESKDDEIKGNTKVTNEQAVKNIDVDEFIERIQSEQYAESDITEVNLIRNYFDYIDVVKVEGNKVLMEINFDDGILSIKGNFNIVDGSNDYSMINQDGKYITSDYNEVKYKISENPTEDNIKKNIMNYTDDKLFDTFNLEDFIFVPSLGENEVNIEYLNYSLDSSNKGILESDFTYTHKDKYFNVEGEISLVIKEVDEVSPPKIEISKNNSKSLGTTPPTNEEIYGKIPESLTVTGVSFKSLNQRELESINIIDTEMKPKLGMAKGIIKATYRDTDDNSDKNIEIPFKIIRKDKVYEIQVDNTANYGI